MRTIISSWVPMASLGALLMGSAVASGQALPADVLACTRQPDALQRLECYDQSVARHDGPHAGAAPALAPDPVVPATPTPTRLAAASATAPAPSAAATAKGAKRLSARVVRVDPFPDAVVVTLDNGQVWEQIQDTGGTPSLRTGETVTIERHGGGYWLSDAGGASMIVRETR